jgi:hypothetical protein
MVALRASATGGALVAAADLFAELRAFELHAAAGTEWRRDLRPDEQRPHQDRPEDEVRNEELAGHLPSIGGRAVLV